MTGNSRRQTSAQGEERWVRSSKGQAFGTPVLDGKRLYTTDGRKAFCFQAGTGRLLWSRKIGTSPIPQPDLVLRDDLVYVTHAGGVRALNAKTGEREWGYESESEPESLAISGEVAYIGVENELRALNLDAK